ncbi:MAG: hypothetical protein M0Z50_14095, partial [Planctomycetia bacterium]|nr:hypothetical protein [Planctomycetia bacterium]
GSLEARTTRGAPTLGYAKTALTMALRLGRERLQFGQSSTTACKLHFEKYPGPRPPSPLPNDSLERQYQWML